MYLRRNIKRKSGKAHTYWTLVRSVRVGSKVRQEVVAYLGELDALGRTQASALARHFLGGKRAQPSLFESTVPDAPVKILSELLKEETDTGVKQYIVMSLGQTKSDEAVPALLEIAKGKDARLATAAVMALGEIGTEKAKAALMEVLEKKKPNDD